MKKVLQKMETNRKSKTNPKMSPEEVFEFLESYNQLVSQTSEAKKSILISIKVDQSLLNSFKLKCQNEQLKYQTQIKKLMRDWVLKAR